MAQEQIVVTRISSRKWDDNPRSCHAPPVNGAVMEVKPCIEWAIYTISGSACRISEPSTVVT